MIKYPAKPLRTLILYGESPNVILIQEKAADNEC